jgi:trigger factor
MQMTQKKVEGLLHQYQLTIPAKQVAGKMDERLLELGKTTKVAGFRPGHIPLPILRQRYATSIKGEVIQKLLDEGVKNLVQEKKLKVALQPKVEFDSAEEDQDLSLNISLEVLPEVGKIELNKYSFEQLKAKIEPQTVTDSLKKMAHSSREQKPLDADVKAKNGHAVRLSFRGTIDDKLIPGGSSADTVLELGSGTFIPGFEEQIVGMKAGDQKDIFVTFPKDYGSRELAGKEAKFSLKIAEVLEVVEPKIDDELAVKLKFKNLAELKEQVEKMIAKEYDELSFLDIKRKVLDKFSEEFHFDLPKGLVELEFQSIWRQLENELHQDHHHAEGEACNHAMDPKEEEKLRKQYQVIAERRVRLGLVLAEIGREHQVVVSQKELDQAVYNEAMRYKGNEMKVVDYYRNTPQALASLRAPIFEDKVIKLITEKVTLKNKEISFEELQKRVKEITEGEEVN